jgi:outer membrane protein OmpA-like peptidoglycan-associated protein
MNRYNSIYLTLFLFMILEPNIIAQNLQDTAKAPKTYAYTVEHQFIFTDFLVSTEPPKGGLFDLPRGMEIAFSKKVNPYTSIRLPIRVGFTKGTKDTTDRVFMGADIQTSFSYDKYAVIPYVNIGVGSQRLSKKWDIGLPIGIGLQMRIDEGYYINTQILYRHTLTENIHTLQYGIGFTMKFGEIKAKLNNPTLASTNEENSNKKQSGMSRLDSLIADSERTTSGNINSSNDIQNPKKTNIVSPLSIINLSNATLNSDYQNTLNDNILDLMTSMTKHNLNTSNEISKDNNSERNKTYNEHDKSIQSNLAYKKLDIQNITFPINQNTLNKEGFAILDSIVLYLNYYPMALLSIEGHTDSSGPNSLNQKLSEARAKVCVDYLKSKGISIQRLRLVGFGEDKPLFNNGTLLGRQKNRRVEFVSFLAS